MSIRGQVGDLRFLVQPWGKAVKEVRTLEVRIMVTTFESETRR